MHFRRSCPKIFPFLQKPHCKGAGGVWSWNLSPAGKFGGRRYGAVAAGEHIGIRGPRCPGHCCACGLTAYGRRWWATCLQRVEHGKRKIGEVGWKASLKTAAG